MLASNILSTLLIAKTLEGVIDIGVQTRAATVAMIYRKALKLSPAARQKSTLGEITNHMAVDAEKWFLASNYMPFILITPFELTLGIYLLSRQLGWSLLAGMLVVAIIIPIQAKFAAFMTAFQDKKLEYMDARL
ncbi:hypothetical protein BGZ83_005376, partial [Gryganskiella cystojenkinii]